MLLDNLNRNLNRPGQANALGLLGAYLMAAGGPQTDPSASGRLLAEGTAQYQNALRQAKLDVGNQQMADLRRQEVEGRIADRQRAAADRARLTAALQGTPAGAAQEAGVMPVAGGMSNAPVEGLLAGSPVLQALAGSNPEAAVSGLLAQRRLDQTLQARKDIAGMKKPSAFEEKVDALTKTGVDRDRAIGIVSGRFATSVNPADGSRTVIDKATGRQVGRPVTQNIPRVKAPEAPKIDVEPGVGGEGLLKDTINTITDLFGAGMFFPEAAKATSALKRLQVVTQTTLQDAVPGRPSNYLMQRLDKMTVSPANLLQGEQRAQINLKETRDLIATSVNTIDQYLDQSLKATTRQKWDLKRRQLKQLQSQYDEIITGFGGGSATGTISPEREQELLQKYGGQ